MLCICRVFTVSIVVSTDVSIVCPLSVYCVTIAQVWKIDESVPSLHDCCRELRHAQVGGSSCKETVHTGGGAAFTVKVATSSTTVYNHFLALSTLHLSIK